MMNFDFDAISIKDGNPGDTMDGSGGAEKRRFYRYPVHQSAFISIGDADPSRCIIWNFSASGAYIVRSLKNHFRHDEELATAEVGSRVRMVFQLSRREEPVVACGQIMRCVPYNGCEQLGLALDTFDRETFCALVRESDEVQARLGAQRSVYAHKHGWCLLADYLAAVFAEAFRRAHERLLLFTNWGDDYESRAHCFYAMVELKSREDVLVRGFLRALLKRLEQDGLPAREAFDTVVRQFSAARPDNPLDGEALERSPFVPMAQFTLPFPEAAGDLGSELFCSALIERLFADVLATSDLPESTRPVLLEVLGESARLHELSLQTHLSGGTRI